MAFLHAAIAGVVTCGPWDVTLHRILAVVAVVVHVEPVRPAVKHVVVSLDWVRGPVLWSAALVESATCLGWLLL